MSLSSPRRGGTAPPLGSAWGSLATSSLLGALPLVSQALPSGAPQSSGAAQLEQSVWPAKAQGTTVRACRGAEETQKSALGCFPQGPGTMRLLGGPVWATSVSDQHLWLKESPPYPRPQPTLDTLLASLRSQITHVQTLMGCRGLPACPLAHLRVVSALDACSNQPPEPWEDPNTAAYNHGA